MQFSPRGGNGTVLTSSDEVVMPAGLEPVITAVKGLRPILLDERTIEAGVSAPDRKFRNDL